MAVATFPVCSNVPNRAASFNAYLQETQKLWASKLQDIESCAKWSAENRNLPHHHSLIYQIKDGSFLEKGSINYSFISGNNLPIQALDQSHTQFAGKPFIAMGISMILHPKNPYVPTVHANLRYFQTQCPQPLWWFAGVMDLTPCYGFDEDCIHWHQTCKQACLPIDAANYPAYKSACDRYYYLPHRQEYRGIGGIWIEQHNQAPFANCQRLIESVGNHFLPAYLPIAKRRIHTPYTQKQREFQQYRRSRYVEFNLLYDRGTKFGLQMGSRAESILVSMPPTVSWPYNWKPEANSAEEKLTQYYLQPQDWIKTPQPA